MFIGLVEACSRLNCYTARFRVSERGFDLLRCVPTDSLRRDRHGDPSTPQKENGEVLLPKTNPTERYRVTQEFVASLTGNRRYRTLITQITGFTKRDASPQK